MPKSTNVHRPTSGAWHSAIAAPRESSANEQAALSSQERRERLVALLAAALALTSNLGHIEQQLQRERISMQGAPATATADTVVAAPFRPRSQSTSRDNVDHNASTDADSNADADDAIGTAERDDYR